MKQTWHWQSSCFLRTCYVPPEQKPGFCHRRLNTRASVFIYDPTCGRLHFTKVFKAVFLFPNLIPESCMPSSRCGVYFPSFWSYTGILTAQINSGVGEAMLHAFWGSCERYCRIHLILLGSSSLGPRHYGRQTNARYRLQDCCKYHGFWKSFHLGDSWVSYE